MTEQEYYKKLSELMKQKDKWEESIDYVAGFLDTAPKLQAKALWMMGEMGLLYPKKVENHLSQIVKFLEEKDSKLRERAIGALGRIGRANYSLVEPYWEELFRFAKDESPAVRLSFIWTSENIATNTPKVYGNCMPIFKELLYDNDTKVRMEAPEIFRVIGKRVPEYVIPYLEELEQISERDENEVVRIHAKGAIRITKKAMEGAE